MSLQNLISMKLRLLLVLLAAVAPVHAVISEPDNLIYGSIKIGGVDVTAANKSVYIEARRGANGPAVARYQMGSDPARGNLYCLELKLESFAPVADAAASEAGVGLVLLVGDATGIRDSRSYTMGARGLVTRVDFGGSGDDNGLPDSWEVTYFGTPGQDPNGDPDHDGRTNLEEYHDNTNPTIPDTRHPADIDPANNFVTINEATAYGLAWKTGQPWSVTPTNIPIDFVTRAGTLWKGGEFYKLDLNVSASAPLWWVNATPPTSPSEAVASKKTTVKAVVSSNTDRVALSNTVTRSMIQTGDQWIITLDVRPATNVEAWAVEETLPAGVAASGISDSGVVTGDKLRWGPFFDASAKTLTYVIATSGAIQITGLGSFDGNSQAITTAAAPTVAGTLTATFQSGTVSLVLAGQPGVEYRLEASEDLMTWTEIERQTADGSGAIRVSQPALEGNRFFRAIAE